MNANGGTLLIGVADDRTLIGIEQDFPFLQKHDRDGWELWLTQLVATALGKVAASELAVAICVINDHEIARIDVGPAVGPVFAMPLKGDKVEKFYARINNSTQELAGQELLNYQKKRWPQ